MEFPLHKICGRPASGSVTLRRCLPGEAPQVFALQNEVRVAMPHPEQFVPDTLEHITGYLRRDICIGAWQGARLGGYLILRCCGRGTENYAAYFGLPEREWPRWANADSAVVHPDWRGNGLQSAMFRAAVPLLPPEIVGVGATISPDNRYSLDNALAGGFEIVCRREMYGGYDRYLLRLRLRQD